MRRQSNLMMPHKTWLELFWSKYMYKALVGVLSSSIWVLYQGQIFLAATEWKNITDLFCFELTHYKVFVFFMFSFRAYGNLATSPKRLESELTNITRRHFCSLPIFYIEHSFIYFIYTFPYPNFFPLFVCFDILWQLMMIHAHDNTRDRNANTSCQNDVTW